jgi:hypothetical protein
MLFLIVFIDGNKNNIEEKEARKERRGGEQ